MEQFTPTTHFQNPEEELAYLRSQVALREKSLSESGAITSREAIAHEVVVTHANTPVEAILAPSYTTLSEQTESLVLKLKPESHDTVMNELYGILMERGVKNTLSVIGQMKSPHIDDDFHRFLVQYIAIDPHVLDVQGISKENPLFKSLHMKLFEVAIPNTGDQKNFKEFMGAMEQFLAGMQGVAQGKNNTERGYYTLELALGHDTPQLSVYVSVPAQKADIFEKNLQAFYKDVKISEVTDDYNIFNEKGVSKGAYITLSKNTAFPIKTYDKFDYDPIGAVLSAFSKLKKEGEGMSLQVLVCPEGDVHIKHFNYALKQLKDGYSIKDATMYFEDKGLDVWRSMSHAFGVVKKKESGDSEDISRLTQKVASTLQSVHIRLAVSAETESRVQEIFQDIESTFLQFEEINSNALKVEKVKSEELYGFLHDFTYRFLREEKLYPLNLREIATIFHFPVGVGNPQLREAKAGGAPAPMDMGTDGILLGYNIYRDIKTPIHFKKEDRMRHMYVIGQTGTGKTVFLKNMVAQDIENGDGCCFIDPHGSDVQDILSYIPKHRIDDVIYFDPAYTARPMGLNMLEFDRERPEQKSLVIDMLMTIFNQLFDMKTGGGAMFEQYFKNAAFLVMDHPESGSTLLEISRVLADKNFRDLKLLYCKNPIVKQFWKSAEETTGDQGLQNFVPYITSKFDTFISNEFMRPVVLQEKSVLNFREIMDKKKILLVNLSKGRLGELNANLIGMLIVMKFQMAALGRADSYGQKPADFFLYIDEFQNVTTPAISSILSEARKYRLSLNVAHQYISQLPATIKDAVFGNVGSMAIMRISNEDAQFLEPKFSPTFTAKDITRLDNLNCYISMIINGAPTIRPFNMVLPPFRKGDKTMVDHIKELSYYTYGRDRAEVEEEIFAKFKTSF